MNTHYKYNPRTAQAGFTLVELSIVLIIIGFLIAGIAAATNMVKQAELRSVMSDVRNYATSYNNFVGKYNAVPGDFSNSDTVFAAQCPSPGCAGDGDGLIELANNETLNAWTHLGAAGFINGNFAATDPAAANAGITLGTNVPPSKVSGAGYGMVGGTTVTGLNFNFSAAQNAVILGKTTASTQLLSTGSLTAEDAHQLDSKMDDGNIDGADFVGAGTGSFRAATGAGATGTCVSGTAPALAYTVSNSSTECIVGFALN